MQRVGSYQYVDTETTGLTSSDEIVEIAIAGRGGDVLLNTLVKPKRHKRWPNAQIDNLTQSILAKAFRGELVSQQEGDKPAAVLLEKIAKAHTEAEALEKAAKKAARSKKAR